MKNCARDLCRVVLLLLRMSTGNGLVLDGCSCPSRMSYGLEMSRVHIPKTSLSRNALTYAKLLCRVCPRRTFDAFEGALLRPGALIDEAALWPTPEYPAIPILLEYAGNDQSGRGHRRSNDIYLLWRYDAAAGAWRELIRCTSQGADWIEQMKPIALREIARSAEPIDARHAADVSGRVLGVLDQALERLGSDERHLVMAFVYQAFSARNTAY